jgi:hypothetical protein
LVTYFDDPKEVTGINPLDRLTSIFLPFRLRSDKSELHRDQSKGDQMEFDI